MQARRVATLIPATLGVCCLLTLALPQCVAAQTKTESAQTISYQIGAGTLDSVLHKFAIQSKLQVVYSPELVAGRTSLGLSGQYSPQQALGLLLKNKEITWDAVSPTMYVLRPGRIEERARPKDNPARESSRQSKPYDDSEGVKELADIVVVGSRLGSSPVESAMPIRVITREDIDRSGAGNIAQALSYLSEVSVNSSGDRPIGAGDGIQYGGSTNSTTVQLRGMPRGTTLVLINGRRSGDSASYSDTGQFDLSTIPLSLVERIEVLPAGSSAIYGGDALAGVVNIVLRRDANGFEVRTRQSDAEGYRTRQASVVWGKTFASADVTIAASWSEEGSLYSSERNLTADQDYRRFGGTDWRSDSSSPGTVYSLDGCPVGLCFTDIWTRANLPGLSSPVAVVPAGSDGISLTPSDFLSTQGQINRTSQQQHLRSAEENFGLTFNGRIELGSTTEGFLELSYTKRDVPAFQLPLITIFPNWAYSFSRVPAGNPYNPFGVDVAVGFNFANTGVFTKFDQSYSRGATGLRGKKSRLEWEVSAWHSIDKTTVTGPLYFDDAAVVAALYATDPQLALNPFIGNGAAPGSQELMLSLAETVDGMARNATTGIGGNVRGYPFSVPAGRVVTLLGVEYQRQAIDNKSNSTSSIFPRVNGETNSTAYFGEARVPLMRGANEGALEKLAATGAVRRESSNRFADDATTEMLGMEWRPTESLLLRGTYSTAFRPLLNYYAVFNPDYRTLTVSDPLQGGTSYQVRIRQIGGVPDDLKPESSENTTVGLIYRPVDNWSLSLTHWDMNFTDQIAFLPLQTLVDEESTRPGRVTRNEQTGLIEEVDARQVNIALKSAAGMDLSFDGSWTTDLGTLHAYLAATYTYKHEQQSTPQSTIESSLDRLTSGGWAPKWKIVPRLGWEHGAFRTFVTGRYVSSYKDSEPLVNGPQAGTVNTLGDFWVFDLNVDVRVGKLLRGKNWFAESSLTLGAKNLLDRLPDFCAGCYQLGYDPGQYDIMGRTIYGELRLSF